MKSWKERQRPAACLLVLVFFLPVPAWAQQAAPQRPIDKIEIQGLLAAGADHSNIAKLVAQRGINFYPTEEYLGELRKAGAKEILIDALREAGKGSRSGQKSGEMRLHISVREPTLVVVDADGKRVLDRVLTPSDAETVAAIESFDLTTADAQAVSLVLNDKPLRHLGASGEIKSVHITHESVKELMGTKQTPPAPVEAPPAAATPLGPIRVNAQTQAAKAIFHPEPKYPRVAKQSHLAGTVTLEVWIGKDGTVSEVKPISGPAPLVKSVIEAVEQWRYTPTYVNGKPVEVMTEVKIVFQSSSK
jgi:TonB family protein